MRFYPYSFLRRRLKRLEDRGETIGLYTHPWETDTEMPRIKLSPLLYLAHYYNLGSTCRKLESLMKDFKFVPYKEAYASHLSGIVA